jgi:ABC-type protease/lipase transport system fused ATPase/permease subunit
MKIRTRSILQELNEYASERNTEQVLESRAANIINSAINLIETIRKTYDSETAGELERRLLNSIKGHDPSRFSRGIRKISESRKKSSE